MLGLLRRFRRKRLRQAAFPEQWRRIIEANVPLYGRLSAEDQRELLGDIQVLLDEKHFEGCGGLEMTDEIRVTVAAQACMLLLHRDTDFYPTLDSILVYPSGYFAPSTERLPGGVVREGPSARLGESWNRGVVVLSWDDVRRGAADIQDGHNLVFHEFAHQLDLESGAAEGAPLLERGSRYVAWARVLGEEYQQLLRDVATGHANVLDRYGATNPAEFFAVTTEAFFERPAELRRQHPDLYQELKDFYRQDPAAILGEN